ncbi:OLC1v1006500C2 [Oldenlandia corymbosa var. corymbosa]|nr:OLC1v1006500C2 [Oldenlandia corymbosa var. corymbosa]
MTDLYACNLCRLSICIASTYEQTTGGFLCVKVLDSEATAHVFEMEDIEELNLRIGLNPPLLPTLHPPGSSSGSPSGSSYGSSSS